MFWTKRAVTKPPQEPIWFGGQPLDVRRSPRARSMRLSIDQRKRAVRLTLPARAALPPALAWAETRRSWAEAQLAKLPHPQPIVPGMLIGVGDEQLRLDWDARHSRVPCKMGSRLQIGGPLETLAARLLRYLRAQAKRVMTAETRQLAAKAGVTISAVGVGDPVSRWGSCSATGAIRYSWRLILAPAFVRQAIVAHEVAHRVHMNHGKAFHALADQLTDGDPKAAHRWLKTHGSSLHAFGRS